MPIAAILALAELTRLSKADTMFQLIEQIKNGISALQASTNNAIGLTAGSDLFLRFVTTARQEHSSFDEHKKTLANAGVSYANTLGTTAREEIAKLTIGFIPDEAVILTHSYSRVVMHALLYAHRRRRITVYVTEARPRGLGVRACEILQAAGVPCSLILDSAVAYVMDKINLVLLGSEAVVESGGLVNAVGSYQMSIVAKAANKPIYALAESYKFLRSFPLSQYDLPLAGGVCRILDPRARTTAEAQRGAKQSPTSVLDFKSPPTTPKPGRRGSYFGPAGPPTLTMSADQVAANPELDYTRPDLITNVVSDVGILAVSAVSQYLVSIYAE